MADRHTLRAPTDRVRAARGGIPLALFVHLMTQHDPASPAPWTIAVGVDFSAPSEQAVAHAEALARTTGATLCLVHVCQIPGSSLGLDAEVRREAIRRTEVEIAQGELDILRRQVQVRLQSDVRTSLVEGSPHEMLSRAALDAGADLLVVGTHGRTGVRRFLMGSVAERAVRASEIDVLVARGQAMAPFHQVLVPVDFSEHALAALRLVARWLPPDGWVELVHALDVPLSQSGWTIAPHMPTEVIDQVTADIRSRGEALVAQLEEVGVEARFATEVGSPARAVQRRADEGGCDLIAMGSHGRTGLKRWVLGSVSETIVRHAPCSVLVCKRVPAAVEPQPGSTTPA